MKRLLIPIVICSLLIGCGKPATEAAKDEHGHEEAGHVEGEAGHKEGKEGEEGHVEGQVKLSSDGLKLAGVETFTAQTREIQDSLRIPGTVMSTTRGRAVVTPPIAGRIVSISVQLGDSVKQGQTLAILESPELAQSWASIAEATKMRDSANSDLKQSKAEVDLSLAKLSASKVSLTRQRDLAKAGAFSQAPVQQAQNELNEAQSELLSVQKEQASHAEQLRRLENLFKEGIVSKSELEAARLELQQDQIRLDRTKAKIENAKATYDRERNIASRGLLNAKELQTAEAEVRSSQLELDRARLRVRAAESALTSANKTIANAQAVYRSNVGTGGGSVGRVALVAPISGTITHVDVTRGQAVDRTQVLLEVENLQSVWVTANVPEQDSAKVQKGSMVQVTVASLPGQVFEGVVQVVGSRVDPKTRSIPTQCLIAGAAGRLKPDMFATIRLGVGSTVRAVVVPKSAILTEDKKSFVFVKDGDAFDKHEVELGQEDGDMVAILSGIKAGEVVASKGAFVLSSEQKKSELKGHDH
ncbi:MAG TPA: efflux RND transporter periplasmic adaptor subunit [Fimbriimonadaceae bacterium]|nr:efflux RND transporter periplasmic adaptor subunit [Fimbriimonadaceae bacterium]